MRISDLSSDVCSSDLRFVEALGDRLHLLDRDLVALGMHAVAQRHVMHLDLDTFEILGHVDSSMSGGRATAAGRERGDSGMLRPGDRSEEHTSELQSLMRISYAVFCLKKKNKNNSEITE